MMSNPRRTFGRSEGAVQLALKPSLRTLLICAAIAPTLFAQQHLAEDRGSVGLAQSLRRLQTTGRVVYMIAHPDDEDGGTVTMLARGKGYTVTLLALSRGEAAGDAVSSDFGPPLGIRRTIELIRSSEYYGARLRISRFLDFGLSKTLAKTLQERGVRIVSGGTDCHMLLVDLRAKNVTGRDAEDALGRAHITVNKNAIPNDPQKPFVASGIRIGSPAMTTRGFRESEAAHLGELIADVLDAPQEDKVIKRVMVEVSELCRRFPVYRAAEAGGGQRVAAA